MIYDKTPKTFSDMHNKIRYFIISYESYPLLFINSIILSNNAVYIIVTNTMTITPIHLRPELTSAMNTTNFDIGIHDTGIFNNNGIREIYSIDKTTTCSRIQRSIGAQWIIIKHNATYYRDKN